MTRIVAKPAIAFFALTGSACGASTSEPIDELPIGADVPVADAEALHEAAPEPKTIRWYDGGHALPPQALSDRHEWLHVRIGLDLLGPPG